MSVRHLLTVAAAALLGGIALAAPAAADVSFEPAAASVYTVSAGRIWGALAGVVALVGVVVGALARTRSAGRVGSRRRGAVVALVLGLVGMAIGVVVVAASDGGLGTGNGRGGGIVAAVLGLIAMAIGGLTLARSHRTS